jgi:uncharacterized OsmC-like protein
VLLYTQLAIWECEGEITPYKSKMRQDLSSLKVKVSNNQHQTPAGEEIVRRVNGNFVMMSNFMKNKKKKEIHIFLLYIFLVT